MERINGKDRKRESERIRTNTDFFKKYIYCIV